MLNYVTIDFPLSQDPPQRVLSFTLKQQRYAHEVISVKFRDWSVKHSSVRPGDPVRCRLVGVGSTREFVGYVHELKPRISPGSSFIEMTIFGASYRLKQARQRVFQNMTASDVVKSIASEYGFNAYVTDHPRVYDQIVQPGTSELQFMSRLARQCGYSLRVQNTSLYFRPMLYDYSTARDSAHTFTMREANNPLGSTLYGFRLTLGDSIYYADAYKSAVQIGGVDPYSAQVNVVTNDRQDTLRQTSATEMFDSFDTGVVAPSLSISAYEAKAADDLNRFPYRATIQVIGTPTISPDSTVYLEGIGNEYSGYWIVLACEHTIVEEGNNVLKYTTNLEIGTDSLGTANKWEGTDVTRPTTSRIRILLPGKRNLPEIDSSTLSSGSTSFYNSLTEVTNRNTPTGTVPYVWASATLEQTEANVAANNRSAVVIQRLENKGAV